MSWHLSTHSPIRRHRFIGLAFMVGGALWIGIFGMIILNGLQTGQLPTAPADQLSAPMGLSLRLFVASIPVLTLALAGLFGSTRHGAPTLSYLATPFMVLALGLSGINLVTLSGLAGTPRFSDTLMGLSIFATAIATGWLSAAALRTRVVERWVGWSLLFVGLSTIPVLFGTPLPIGPDWATDYLAFLLSGIAFVSAGYGLRSAPMATKGDANARWAASGPAATYD